MSKTLEEIIEECRRDSETWFPSASHDLTHQTLGLCGEVGELANLVKKVGRGTHEYATLKNRMREEATDAFVYLCNVFALLEMDPVTWYDTIREHNLQRFGTGRGDQKVVARGRSSLPD
jgi:NTP pyrophosphatase (non-canonical NTP hydrolase)